jgi:hypothetical protein
VSDNCLLSQEKLKPEFLEGLPEKMKLYSQFLGKRPWFAGDKVKGREMGRRRWHSSQVQFVQPTDPWPSADHLCGFHCL